MIPMATETSPARLARADFSFRISILYSENRIMQIPPCPDPAENRHDDQQKTTRHDFSFPLCSEYSPDFQHFDLRITPLSPAPICPVEAWSGFAAGSARSGCGNSLFLFSRLNGFRSIRENRPRILRGKNSPVRNKVFDGHFWAVLQAGGKIGEAAV